MRVELLIEYDLVTPRSLHNPRGTG